MTQNSETENNNKAEKNFIHTCYYPSMLCMKYF